MCADEATARPKRRPAVQMFGWRGVAVADQAVVWVVETGKCHETFKPSAALGWLGWVMVGKVE